jgi:hypothetical protein
MTFAISLYQPWATLIMLGAKCFETRHWDTEYRGVLIIHAAKAEGDLVMCKQPMFANVLVKAGITRIRDLPLGAALGAVDLVATHSAEKIAVSLSNQERAFGNYGPGRRAWELRKPRPFPAGPIWMPGKQGLWNWETAWDARYPILPPPILDAEGLTLEENAEGIRQ